jgi:hypothetical protein
MATPVTQTTVVETPSFTESFWFRLLVAIVTGFIAGYSLAAIIYFDRLRNLTPSTTAITSGEAAWMLGFSVLIFVLAIILFLWSIYRLIFSSGERQTFYTSALGYATSPNLSIKPATTTTTTTVPVTGTSVAVAV